MAGKADGLKELNVSEDATPYGSEFQTLNSYCSGEKKIIES